MNPAIMQSSPSSIKYSWEEFTQMVETGSDIRQVAMIAIAGFTGFRSCDWITFKWSDVWKDGEPVSEMIWVKEKKTGKKRKVFFHDTLREILTKYREHEKPQREEQYLFRPRRGGNRHSHITSAGARFNIGATHAFRRTFAWDAYVRAGANFTALCIVGKMLNHSNPATTIRYLGIEQETIQNLYLRK